MKKTLATLLILVAFLTINAQTYTFSLLSQPYTYLNGGTDVNGGQEWDDFEVAVPIGFNFSMFGVQSNVAVIADAYFIHDYFSQPFITAGAVFLADLVDRAYGNGNAQSPITYLTSGTTGSRIFKCEWRNAGFYNDQDELDSVNFQLWLYETTNVIEIHIGPNSVVNPDSYDPESGAGFGPVKIDTTSGYLTGGMILTGAASNPTPYSIMSPLPQIQFVGGTAPANTVYRFAPVSQQSVPENSNSEIFILYPNPAVNELTLFAQNNYYNNVTLQIKNQLGQVMISEQHNLSASGSTINISELPLGVYCIDGHTSDGNKILAQKIIKTK